MNAQTKVLEPLKEFFRETRSELRKVVWPSRRETINLTVLVIATSLVVGAGLGVVDFLFEQLIFLIVR